MKLRSLAMTALLFLVTLNTVSAAECEPAHDPAPASDMASGVNFYNDTQYAFKVFWAGEDGFLQEYGMAQPSEKLSFNTFVGHQWFVEMYTPDGAECLGPISANQSESCEAHILWNEGIGIDAGYCDF
jgi:hypothetical protein